MEIMEIMEILENNDFLTRTVEYKDEFDKEKYGQSFDAMTNKDYKFIRVNGVEVKGKRIIEEYGSILIIYNGNQAQIKKEDINTFEVL